MAYYVVERSYTMRETVIVKAASRWEAFQNAADDVNCDVQSETDGDYEPDYQSVAIVRYVSEATKKRIG